MEVVEWRRITGCLWIGTCDGRHVGHIAYGLGFIAIDREGAALGRFRTLRLAEAALSTRTASGDVAAV